MINLLQIRESCRILKNKKSRSHAWPPARARACRPAGGAGQADRVPMGSGGGKHVTIVRLAVFADREQ
jgi:hypothetical protein